VVEHVVRIWPWRFGNAEQLHACLFGSGTGFGVVARDAGANDVFPDVGAASGTRHYVVKGQVFCRITTVLALEPIPIEDGLTRKPASHQRPLYHVDESYDRRNGNLLRNSA